MHLTTWHHALTPRPTIISRPTNWSPCFLSCPSPHNPFSLEALHKLDPTTPLLKTLQRLPNSAEKTQPSELAPVASVHTPAHTPQAPCFALCSSSLCVCYSPTPSSQSGIFCPQTSSSHQPLTQVSAEPLSYWGFLESMDPSMAQGGTLPPSRT